MAEEPKKISFGFTKINKKPVLSLPKKEEKEIQFITCLEENNIKLLNGEEKEKELPIIPLRNGNILRDNMIEALKARKEKKKHDTLENIKTDNSKDGEETQILTLDELAAKEILEDLKKVNETEEIQETLTIPQVEAVKVSEKESTLEDYDSMPVNQFGLAVLRGMGWKPDKGIGKNAKIVEPINPVLRPKGMGLGADKVIQAVKTESKEELVMKKGAFIKVISGQNKGLYGKIEGFDDLPGRIIVRLTLRNDVVSISENIVVLVTSSEYNRNSKILNLNKYNNFLDNKPLPAASTTKEKPPERNIKKDTSSDDDKSSKQQYKDFDSYRQISRKKSDEVKHSKYKYSRGNHISSESDSDRRTKHKSDKYKTKRSSRYDKVSVDTESSDSVSSDDRKKSKSKKHRKHSSKHRSRSRSRTHKKKKKRNHRSRS